MYNFSELWNRYIKPWSLSACTINRFKMLFDTLLRMQYIFGVFIVCGKNQSPLLSIKRRQTKILTTHHTEEEIYTFKLDTTLWKRVWCCQVWLISLLSNMKQNKNWRISFSNLNTNSVLSENLVCMHDAFSLRIVLFWWTINLGLICLLWYWISNRGQFISSQICNTT